MAHVPQHQNSPLGGFRWLDNKPRLRRWFANWLTKHWRRLYRDSLHQLHTKEDFEAYSRMEKAVKELTGKLPGLSTGKQLATLDTAARQFSYSTTRERVEDELRYFLTRAGQYPKNTSAFKASPWCDHFITEKHILEQAGKNLPCKLYPDDPNLRLALENVIAEFGSIGIWREVSSAMSGLFAVQRGLAQFNEAIKRLPTESAQLSGLAMVDTELRKFSIALQSEINKRVNEPAALTPPLHVRHLQRALYAAVHRLCKPKDGPDKLAEFLQNLLKEWPHVPAGMELDLKNHFNADKRYELVRNHLSLTVAQTNKEARALWRVLHAVIFRNELRSPLLALAHDARLRAEKRRKGWEHLRKALRVLFNHIRREATDEEQFRNFERANFASMRSLTREQRMLLLPELGNDSDHSIRDLTKAERMLLAARYLKKTRTRLERDVDGKNSFATRYGRAMKAVREELGQD